MVGCSLCTCTIYSIAKLVRNVELVDAKFIHLFQSLAKPSNEATNIAHVGITGIKLISINQLSAILDFHHLASSGRAEVACPANMHLYCKPEGVVTTPSFLAFCLSQTSFCVFQSSQLFCLQLLTNRITHSKLSIFIVFICMGVL